MLYHFTKYQSNVAKLSRLTKYCVLNERGKFGAKIFSLYTDIVIFVLWYFNLNYPVHFSVQRTMHKHCKYTTSMHPYYNDAAEYFLTTGIARKHA